MLVCMGCRRVIARYLAKYGIARMCLFETKYEDGVPHHFGGVPTSLKIHRTIWGITAIVSQYRANMGPLSLSIFRGLHTDNRDHRSGLLGKIRKGWGGGRCQGGPVRNQAWESPSSDLKPVTLKPVSRIFRVSCPYFLHLPRFRSVESPQTFFFGWGGWGGGERDLPHFPHLRRIRFESLTSKIRPTGFIMTSLR